MGPLQYGTTAHRRGTLIRTAAKKEGIPRRQKKKRGQPKQARHGGVYGFWAWAWLFGLMPHAAGGPRERREKLGKAWNWSNEGHTPPGLYVYVPRRKEEFLGCVSREEGTDK